MLWEISSVWSETGDCIFVHFLLQNLYLDYHLKKKNKMCLWNTNAPAMGNFSKTVTLIFDLDPDRWLRTWHQQKRSCNKVYSCEIWKTVCPRSIDGGGGIKIKSIGAMLCERWGFETSVKRYRFRPARAKCKGCMSRNCADCVSWHESTLFCRCIKSSFLRAYPI